jgi:hypothetical protein
VSKVRTNVVEVQAEGWIPINENERDEEDDLQIESVRKAKANTTSTCRIRDYAQT